MRKSISLLGLGLLVLFLISTMQVGAITNSPIIGGSGGCCFIRVCDNDAGYIYNLSYSPTFFTAILNLTGTYSFNFTEGKKVPCVQQVAFYIALGTMVKWYN